MVLLGFLFIGQLRWILWPFITMRQSRKSGSRVRKAEANILVPVIEVSEFWKQCLIQFQMEAMHLLLKNNCWYYRKEHWQRGTDVRHRDKKATLMISWFSPLLKWLDLINMSWKRRRLWDRPAPAGVSSVTLSVCTSQRWPQLEKCQERGRRLTLAECTHPLW